MAIGSIGLLGRLGALIGQPAVQAVVAGALTGAVGGTALIGTGVIPIGGSQQSAPTLGLVSCPGSSTILGQVTTGQPLLVTARSRDGQWLQVYIGAPGLDRAWAPATSVSLQASGDGLPVADCTLTADAATPPPTLAASSEMPTPVVSAIASPATGPTPGPTPVPVPTPTLAPGQTPPPTPKPTPTAKPTAPPTPPPTAPPTPSPAPTPTPDLTAPVLSNLTANPTCVGPDIASSTISVVATDPGGGTVASVTIVVSPPGASQFSAAMSAGSSNTWTYVIGYHSNWLSDYVHYTVTAKDKAGNVSSSLSDDNTTTTNFLYNANNGCIIF